MSLGYRFPDLMADVTEHGNCGQVYETYFRNLLRQ